MVKVASSCDCNLKLRRAESIFEQVQWNKQPNNQKKQTNEYWSDCRSSGRLVNSVIYQVRLDSFKSIQGYYALISRPVHSWMLIFVIYLGRFLTEIFQLSDTNGER